MSSKYRVTKGFKFHARPQTGAYSCYFYIFGLFKTEFSYSFQSAAKIGDLNPPLYVRGIKFSVIIIITILCPILAYFLKNWSTHRAKKDAFKEKSIFYSERI